MIYFIYGHQLPVIKKTLKNLIKTCLNGIEQDDFNVQKLSARLVPIQEIVFDAMSLPLGSDKKVLVVTEPYFLSNEKEKVSALREGICKENKLISGSSAYGVLLFFYRK